MVDDYTHQKRTTLDSVKLATLTRFSSDGTASGQLTVRYISLLVCLFYRYQGIRNADIVFQWYRNQSDLPQEYTVSVGSYCSLGACMDAINQLPEEGHSSSGRAQFAVVSGFGRKSDLSLHPSGCELHINADKAQLRHAPELPYQSLYEHAEHVIQRINSNALTGFSEIEIPSDTDMPALLSRCGNSREPRSASSNIHQYVEIAAKNQPNRNAILSEDGNLTFSELNRSANQLARAILRKIGTNPQPIAVDLKRGPSLIIALLAVLKAGHHYLPIDQNAPLGRVQLMLDDCACQLRICDCERDFSLSTESLHWDRCRSLMKTLSGENLDLVIRGDAIAYVNYTSGSTGVPKGVEVYHRGVVRLNYRPNYIDYEECTRMLQISNVGFDAATFEIWGALMNAAPLVLYAGSLPTVKGLMHHVNYYGANTTFLTTSLFNFLADNAPHVFSKLRYVIFGGEKVSIKHVAQVRAQSSTLKLVHAYGPTECTTFATTYPINALNDSTQVIPIGKPINETQIYLLDEKGNQVAPGVPGEIHIGGTGVAKGYHNQPEKTRSSFLLMSGPLAKAGVLYRTGDIAYLLPSGDLVFVGRRDDQIKIRGFRVEIGEITNVLSEHPKVAQLYTAFQGGSYDDKQIIVYFVPERDNAPTAAEIRKFAKEKLPNYMVPSQVIRVSRFPLTANGKIDKARVADFHMP